MRPLVPAAAAALLAAALPGSARSDHDVGVERAALGRVAATLTVQEGSRSPLLRILRRGSRAHAARVPPACPGCIVKPSGSGPSSVAVLDLEGDGEPEVLLSLFSGGINCCVLSYVYRFDGFGYRLSRWNWGRTGFRVVDRLGGGIPELEGADTRFHCRFSACPVSASPLRIVRFSRGRFLDVTARHPAAVRASAAELWRQYLRLRANPNYELRGVLAAWAAEQARLGRGAAAFARLEALRRRGELDRGFEQGAGTEFLERVRAELVRLGYL